MELRMAFNDPQQCEHFSFEVVNEYQAKIMMVAAEGLSLKFLVLPASLAKGKFWFLTHRPDLESFTDFWGLVETYERQVFSPALQSF